MSGPEVRVVADAEAAALAVAETFTRAAEESVEARGVFRAGLCGGSTPRGAYRRLAAGASAGRVTWPKSHLYFSDERCVPPDHPDSNYRMVRETLLAGMPAAPAGVHRMQGELDPHEAADRYDELLRKHFEGGPPRLDVLLLGMGSDGHTASLFPGTAALQEVQRRCVANHVLTLDAWRLTLTFPAINAARRVVFLITGASKAAMVRDVLERPRDPERRPSQGVRPADGELEIILDAEAASQLGARAG